jgi:hypothetical protein
MADCAAEEQTAVHVSPNRPWASGRETFQFRLVVKERNINVDINIINGRVTKRVVSSYL